MVNGFLTEKEKEVIDKTNMPTVMKVQQQIRLRLASPLIFKQFFTADWFKGIFRKEYEEQKKKKIKSIRESFLYSWYDLQWWWEKLNNEEQQYQAQKDKDNLFVNLYKGYKRISGLAKWYKVIKTFVETCQNNQAVKTLFSQNYNLSNQGDYRKFQRNLNNVIQNVQDLVIPSIKVFTLPMMKKVSYLYAKTLQKLYDRFCWWLIKTIIIGERWWEVALTLAGAVASIFTAGAASGLIMAGRITMVTGRLISAFGRFLRIGNALIKSSNLFVRGIGRGLRLASSGIGRTGSLLLRGGGAMGRLGSRGLRTSWTLARNTFTGKIYRGAKAWRKRHWLTFKAAKYATQAGVTLALFYYDDQHYNRVYREIRKRTALMYMGLQSQLVGLQYTGQMVGDLSGLIVNFANNAWDKYVEVSSPGYNNSYRTNRKYRLSLQIDPNQKANNPFYIAMNIFTRCFNIRGKDISNVLDYIGGIWNYYKTRYTRQFEDRFVVSLGQGDFGIALYKNITRLVFQNVKFNTNEGFIGGNLKQVFKKIVFTDQGAITSPDGPGGIYVDGKIRKTILYKFEHYANRPFIKRFIAHRNSYIGPNDAIMYKISKFYWLYKGNIGEDYRIKCGFCFHHILKQYDTVLLFVDGRQITDNRYGDVTFNTSSSDKIFSFGHSLGLDIVNQTKNIIDYRNSQFVYQQKFSQECQKMLKSLEEKVSQRHEGSQRVYGSIIAQIRGRKIARYQYHTITHTSHIHRTDTRALQQAWNWGMKGLGFTEQIIEDWKVDTAVDFVKAEMPRWVSQGWKPTGDMSTSVDIKGTMTASQRMYRPKWNNLEVPTDVDAKLQQLKQTGNYQALLAIERRMRTEPLLTYAADASQFNDPITPQVRRIVQEQYNRYQR